MTIRIPAQDWQGSFAAFARDNAPFIRADELERLYRELTAKGESTLDAGMGAPFVFLRVDPV